MRSLVFAILAALLAAASTAAAEKKKALGEPSVGWGPGSRSDAEVQVLNQADEVRARIEALRTRPASDGEPTPTPAPAPQLARPVADDVLAEDPTLSAPNAIASMNAVNPLSSDFSGGELVKKKLSESLGVSRAAIDWLTSLKVWPRLFSLVKDPQFLTDAKSVAESPRRPLWLWTQLAWVLVCVILNFWRMSATEGFMRRLFERAWVTGVFVAGTIFFVPWALFGNPYFRIASSAASAFFGS